MLKDLRKNNEAQVLGLPMYLIIIMIIAVVVIAAVIFMMPSGNKMMNVQVIEGAIADEGTTDTGGNYSLDAFDVKVKVVSADDRADPIVGATVTLKGGGIAEVATTDTGGVATFTDIDDGIISPNKNSVDVEVKVTASGYEDYSKTDGVELYRP